MKKVFRISAFLMTVLLTACSGNGTASFTSVGETSSGHFTDIQAAYLKNNDPSDTSPYNGNMSKSESNPVHLYWESSGIKEFKVNIYRDEDLKDLVVSYETKEDHLDFYNGELLQTYYWNVTDKSGNVVSVSSSFVDTIDVAGPRNLKIDGVENFRDIGGWGVLDESGYHRYMKQGMIYRSGRFNEDKANTVNVTVSESGLHELNDHLKIKTEIDLRRSGNNEIGSLKSSPLGDKVQYYNLPMYFGGNNILTYSGTVSGDNYAYDNPKAIKQFFEILADEKNYPINFHCSIGKDRTGCMAYLIEGLLGFDQEVMYRDYMFTNFANAGMCKLQDDILNRYGATLSEYEVGTTLKEKVFNYLKNVIGVEETKLNNIINILKENTSN